MKQSNLNNQSELVEDYEMGNTDAGMSFTDEVKSVGLGKAFDKAPKEGRRSESIRVGKLSTIGDNTKLVRFDDLTSSIVYLATRKDDIASITWDSADPAVIRVETCPGFRQNRQAHSEDLTKLVSMVLKSRNHPEKFYWELGEDFIEITYQNPSMF